MLNRTSSAKASQTNLENKYARVTRVLHWLVAGLIVTQYIIAELAERAEHANQIVSQLALLANHKSLGITIFALAVVRLVWRSIQKPPALPASMPVWQTRASKLSHATLYGLLFAIPLTGWLMSSATAYSVSWFNLFVLPDLIGVDETNAQFLENIHEWLGKCLLAIALLHILAALKHHFIDKDTVLKRMASPSGWLILVMTIALVLALFARNVVTKTSTVSPSSVPASPAVLDEKTIKSSELAVWNIDYADSYITFSGDQAGAPFKGQWQQWRASIQFDTNQPSAGLFNVTIEPASVFSNDKTRDDYIRDPDFFDIANHQQASFIAQEFQVTEVSGSRAAANGVISNGKNFVAKGFLTMKGIRHPLDFNFSVTQSPSGNLLQGQAVIDRLMWNIGMGQWTDTSWVGQEILVTVRVSAPIVE